MCGGFAVHFADGTRDGGRWAAMGRQLGWHAGRLATYAFLGGLAGFLGRSVSLLDWPTVSRSAGVLAGIVTLLMGLRLLGFPGRLTWRGRQRSTGVSPMQPLSIEETFAPRPDQHGQDARTTPFYAHVMGQFLRKPSIGTALAFGLANGWLPCPVTLAFLAQAAHSTSVATGMAILTAMGVGTMTSLLPAGLLGLAVRTRWNRHGVLLAGGLLVVLGGWTLVQKLQSTTPSCCH